MSLNACQLIGRLTADPTCRIGNEHESATFRLAVDRPGSKTTDYFDVVTFDALAKVCGDYLIKGRQVAVTGRLRLNEWTTDAGEKRSKIQVVADQVSFLDRKKPDHGADSDVDAEADVVTV